MRPVKRRFEVRQLGANVTLLQTLKGEVLFSYRTPVAVSIYGRRAARTSEHFSRTTSKHQTRYCHGYETVDPETFDQLLQEVAA